MIYLWFVAWMCISSSSAQQYYDPSKCSSDNSYLGSRYTCNSSLDQDSCRTFLVYRANQRFQTISDISKLFNKTSDKVLHLNNMLSSSQVLKPGKEVLLPVYCACSGQFYQANFNYEVPENTTYSEIACGVFEGLLKSLTLSEENLPQGKKLEVEAGSELRVPLRCACPDNFTSSKRVKYLVTYPLVEGDETTILSEKFGISHEDFWAVNHLNQWSTLFPNTTVLIPLRDGPIRLVDIPDSPPPPRAFLSTNPVAKTQKAKEAANLYVAGSIVGFLLLFITMLASGLYMKAFRKCKGGNIQSFTSTNSPSMWSPLRSSPLSAQTGRSSSTSCLSPDLLVGIKYCLIHYSIEELRKATKDFSEENRMGDSVYYKGLVNNHEVMIKKMRFEDTRQVIDLHSKINHKNFVNLRGVCYGENDFSWSFLVFELPKNGCLRDCLSDPCNPLPWLKRTQIAFDIATGLHYLHCCAFPFYAHMDVSSRNTFITANWRGKLADIGMASAANVNDSTENLKGRVAPEYLGQCSVSEKVDIFAYGVVLLELLSARDYIDGKSVKDSIEFLGGGACEEGCFEGLRNFMDPNLKDYPLAEALCLAVLAKACVAEDPLHRPTMDDIMKVLAKMA